MSPTLLRGGFLALFIAATVSLATATASGSFRPSIDPPSVPSQPGAAFSACPNPAGLEQFDALSTKLAESVARSYGHFSLALDLTHSDRSFWPMLRHFWQPVKHGAWLQAIQVVRRAQIGGPKMVWSGVVGHYCGAKLVTDSLDVRVTVRHLQRCADCSGVDELFIDRRGVPLVYMVH